MLFKKRLIFPIPSWSALWRHTSKKQSSVKTAAPHHTEASIKETKSIQTEYCSANSFADIIEAQTRMLKAFKIQAKLILYHKREKLSSIPAVNKKDRRKNGLQNKHLKVFASTPIAEWSHGAPERKKLRTLRAKIPGRWRSGDTGMNRSGPAKTSEIRSISEGRKGLEG